MKNIGVTESVLIAIGIVLILTGVFWPILSKMPFGNLPGDIRIEKDTFKFYAPITTCVLISVVISLLIRIWNYFR